MPTKIPAAKKPTRKTGSAKPAMKKTSATKTAPKRRARARPVSAAAATADAASLGDLVTRLGKIELAGLAGRLVQGWRKDLQVIAEASQRSYTGLQAVVARQTAQIKDAAGELQSVGKVMANFGVKESVRSLDDLALASLQLALADVRELAELAASSQREAYELMHRRVTENIDDLQQLLRK